MLLFIGQQRTLTHIKAQEVLFCLPYKAPLPVMFISPPIDVIQEKAETFWVDQNFLQQNSSILDKIGHFWGKEAQNQILVFFNWLPLKAAKV